MNENCYAAMAGWMREFPEVKWDRFSGGEPVNEWAAFYTMYGWISRSDGYADFLAVDLAWEDLTLPPRVGYVTSSAEWSAVFGERIYGPANEHHDCQRVEDLFPAKLVANVVRL